MRKRILSVLLTLCMVLTMLPTVALAVDPLVPTVSGTAIFGNGVALIIDGSSDTSTTVYIDADMDGVLDEGEQSLAETGITGAPADDSDLSAYTIYGGAQTGTITGDSMITINGGKVGSVYGGNFSNSDMSGGVAITMNGGSAARLIACGYNDDVGGTGKTVSVSIHGGTVYGGSDDDINLYSRNNADTTSLLIDGGMINGTIVVKKTGASFVIKGGNILATITSGDEFASPTDGTNPVYKTTLTLKDGETAKANTVVTALTTDADYTYGMGDVTTDANGKLYVYLPADTVVTAAATADGTYTGSVTTTTAGTASGELTVGAFVPVTNITRDFVDEVDANDPLTLYGTVAPNNATNGTIVWSVSPFDAGTTGAAVDSSGVFTATTAGTATVRATITDGMAVGTPYTQDFYITVAAPVALTGTVTITGTEKYGSELTAAVTGSNNSGTLSYQWKRGTTNIGTDSDKYTLVADDIGKTITCEVTSSVQTGTISGSTTGTIGKADGPIAPAGLAGVKPSTLGASDGKITGTTALMQYDDNTEFTSPDTCGASETIGLAAGTYYVRVAATTTTEAGAYATVTVPAGDAATHTVTVSGSYAAPNGAGDYAQGDTVTIHAGTRAEYTFNGWTTTSSGVSFDNANSATTTFSMPGNAVTVTANWTPNGGGGGGGGGAESKALTVPVTGSGGSVQASAEVSGKTATIDVTDAQLGKLTSGEGSVTVDVSSIKVDAAVIPAKLASQAEEIEVALPASTVKLDSAAVESAGGQSITVCVETVAASDLSSAQKSALGNDTGKSVIVDVNVLVNGVKTSQFGGGVITIGIPYAAAAGEDTSKLAVYYLADDGSFTKMSGYYDAGKKAYVFTTTHLSAYVLMVQKETLPFDDVTADDWFYDDVAYVSAAGLMKGTGATVFDPSGTITRGMIAEILFRMAGEPAVTGKCTFDDVASGAYYEHAVIWAAENNIVSGFGNGKFAPEAPITREQMASMLYRYEQLKGGGFTGSWMFRLDFADADSVSEWAYEAMCWCTMNGIISGVGGGMLAPGNSAQRCQAAAILHRFCENPV